MASTVITGVGYGLSFSLVAVMQAKEAFLAGLHLAVGIGGLLTLLVGIAAWFWLPRKLPE